MAKPKTFRVELWISGYLKATSESSATAKIKNMKVRDLETLADMDEELTVEEEEEDEDYD